MATNPVRMRYLADTVSTATPGQLVVMLYDRLGLDLRQAAEVQAGPQPWEASSHLRHAQAILAELIATLRTDVWDGAQRLNDIYSFVLRELIDVNATPDPSRLRRVAELVAGLRDAWARAAAGSSVRPEPVLAARGNWVG
jgi:flagellar protein FliS